MHLLTHVYNMYLTIVIIRELPLILDSMFQTMTQDDKPRDLFPWSNESVTQHGDGVTLQVHLHPTCSS